MYSGSLARGRKEARDSPLIGCPGQSLQDEPTALVGRPCTKNKQRNNKIGGGSEEKSTHVAGIVVSDRLPIDTISVVDEILVRIYNSK